MSVEFTANDNTIEQGKTFVLNGIAYPFNWLELASPEDLEAHGITKTVTEDVPIIVPDPEPMPVPTAVTPRQARLALLGAGLLSQVELAVNAAGGAAKITWEYATMIERNDPLIASLAVTLGLTDVQIDELFEAARNL